MPLFPPLHQRQRPVHQVADVRENPAGCAGSIRPAEIAKFGRRVPQYFAQTVGKRCQSMSNWYVQAVIQTSRRVYRNSAIAPSRLIIICNGPQLNSVCISLPISSCDFFCPTRSWMRLRNVTVPARNLASSAFVVTVP